MEKDHAVSSHKSDNEAVKCNSAAIKACDHRNRNNSRFWASYFITIHNARRELNMRKTYEGETQTFHPVVIHKSSQDISNHIHRNDQ